MFEVIVEGSFSSAHNLRGKGGKCEGLHGHNWKVAVVIQGEKLDKWGMLVDFREVKRYLEEVLEKLDHRYLNSLIHFRRVNPTSENIAKFIFRELAGKLNHSRFRVGKVTVWESETTSATYSGRK